MDDGPGRRRRRSIRVRTWDYAHPAAYFVTICTHQRQCLLGTVVDGEVHLSAAGEIVRACWDAIPAHFPHVVLDKVIVMPNHVHGIILICEYPAVGAQHAAPLRQDSEREPHVGAGSLGAIVRSFKSAATKAINEHRGTRGLPVWQRSYYERIIRNDRELAATRDYIAANPYCWADDPENPL